jgi:hypothetical protein
LIPKRLCPILPFMKRWLTAVFTLAVLSLASCTKKRDTTLPSYEYMGLDGYYDLNIKNDKTFVLTYASVPLSSVTWTASGAYARNSSTGFVTLTVTEATGTGAPAVAASTYALELGGLGFIMKPFDSDATWLPLITATSCPTANLDLNAVRITPPSVAYDASTSAQNFFGTFTYDNSAHVAAMPHRYEMTAWTDAGSTQLGSSACSNKVTPLSTSGNYLLMNPSSLGAVFSYDSSLWIVWPRNVIASVKEYNGDYAGIMFNDGLGTGTPQRLFPLQAEASDGTFTFTAYDNFDSSILADDSMGHAVFANTGINAPRAGFMGGTLTIGSQSGGIVCNVSKKTAGSTKNSLVCVAQAPNNNSGQVNLVLFSR